MIKHGSYRGKRCRNYSGCIADNGSVRSISGKTLEWSKDRTHGIDVGSFIPIAVVPSVGMAAWPLFCSLAAPGKIISRGVKWCQPMGNQADFSAEQPLGHPEPLSRETGALRVPMEAGSLCQRPIVWGDLLWSDLPLELVWSEIKCCILPRTENVHERLFFRQRKLNGESDV